MSQRSFVIAIAAVLGFFTALIGVSTWVIQMANAEDERHAALPCSITLLPGETSELPRWDANHVWEGARNEQGETRWVEVKGWDKPWPKDCEKR